MDWLESFAKVAEGLDPVIEAAATLFFPEVPAVAKAVSYGVRLIEDAHKAYEAGQGPMKKDFVMQGAADFLAGLIDCSEGHGSETFHRFAPFMSAVIEGVLEGVHAVGAAGREPEEGGHESLKRVSASSLDG